MSNWTCWFVGASWGGQDQTKNFIQEGVWKNGSDKKNQDKVNAIAVGDKIAIKSSYTKKHGLSFDSKGNVVSVLAIKATGTVIENLGDGQTIKVDWDAKEHGEREWYFYTYRGRIWEVDPNSNWYAKELCEFAFENKKQDIDRFRNDPYWVERYGDFSEIEKALGHFLDEAAKAKGLRNRKQAAEYIVEDDEWKEVSSRKQCFDAVGQLFAEQEVDSKKLRITLQNSKIMPAHGSFGSMFSDFFKHENIQSWLRKLAPSQPITKPEEINGLIDEVERMGFHDNNGKPKRSEAAFFLSVLLASIFPDEYMEFRQSKVDILTDEFNTDKIKGDYGDRFLKLSQFYRTIFSTTVFQENFSKFDCANAIVGGLSWIFESKEEWMRGEVDMSKATDNLTRNSLNTILYGPPGTGKTYHTVKKAVEICDPQFQGDYKERYKQLQEEGRIEFVTFHQSYGYEEFIEGIKPELDSSDSGRLTYKVEKGVFRRIADRCNEGLVELEKAIEKFKQECEETSNPIELETPARKKKFKVSYEGASTFKISPDSTQATYGAGINDIFEIYKDPNNLRYSRYSYPKAIILHLKKKYGVPDYTQTSSLKAHVLIIDEINRGNMSKIFGELITLIEDDKRLGVPNEMTVRLPVSGVEFGVPSNLHIIGTMNTADRSIAMMDTALRRRFAFEEMMPDASLLKGIEVAGIKLEPMLKAINERIEVLYDREHTIGHAFFMGLASSPSPDALKVVFQNKVIPLLAEYFFEDWEKIRLVLGDNRKEQKEHQFIVEKEDVSYQALFGDESSDYSDERKVYGRNPEALDHAESYIGIYEPKAKEKNTDS